MIKSSIKNPVNAVLTKTSSVLKDLITHGIFPTVFPPLCCRKTDDGSSEE